MDFGTIAASNIQHVIQLVLRPAIWFEGCTCDHKLFFFGRGAIALHGLMHFRARERERKAEQEREREGEREGERERERESWRERVGVFLLEIQQVSEVFSRLQNLWKVQACCHDNIFA